MLQLGPTPAEIQYVKQAEARRQSASDQLAAAWAGSVGGPSGTIASVSANPMPMELLGTGIDIGGPSPRSSSPFDGDRVTGPPAPEDDDDFDWGGAAQGAASYGMSGAAIGTKILPGWGTAIGGGLGAIAGALIGGFGD